MKTISFLPHRLFNVIAVVSALWGLTIACPAACIPPSSGLVGWWRAEGNASDAVGANNGVLLGNTVYGTGKVGNGFVFDGNGDGVALGNPANLQLQNFTFEGWIRRSSASVISQTGNEAALLACGSSGYGFSIFANGSLSLTQVGVDNVVLATGIVDTNWHHVAVTKTNSVVIFYVDGVAYLAPPYNPTFEFTSGIMIGSAAGFTFGLYGSIDELAIFNRALSTPEIQAIYNASSSGKCVGTTAPVIILQPTNQTVFVGENVALATMALGTPPLFYQWSLNGTNISAGTNESLTITNSQATDAGDYIIRVTNLYGAATSQVAVLTVNSQPPCTPPPTGLLSWWPGNGAATDIADGNSGTLAGSTTFGPGKVGQAFVFDGSGDGVQIGSPPNLRLQHFTIEAWIQRSSASVISLAGNEAALFAYGGGGYGFTIFANGSLSLTKVGVDNVVVATGILDTSWHHVAVAKTNNLVVFYVDGVAYAAPSYNPTFDFTTSTTIGSAESSDYSFYGSIDELAVYNRALPAIEIQAIYNAGSLGKCAGPTAPLIIVQPTNQIVVAGGNVSFGAMALGPPPLSYQWAFYGTNIPAATNSTLTITNAQLTNAGNYVVIVTNLYGSTTSAVATLTVNSSPVCASSPSGIVSWWPGDDVTTDIVGTNNGTLSGNATFGLGRVGRAFVFDGNADGVVLGNPASLQLQNFTIETWIKRASASVISLTGNEAGLLAYGAGGYGFTIFNNGNLSLTQVGVNNVVAGTGIVDTNWHHLAVSKSGGTVVFYVDGVAYAMPPYNPTFTFTSGVTIGSADNGGYSFYGSIDELAVYNRALSEPEIQAIYSAGSFGKCLAPSSPLIILQPTNQTVFASETASFGATALGPPPLSYQWFFYGTNIPVATNSILTITNAQPINAGNYFVILTNLYGSTTSSVAVLTVNPPPACAPVPSGLLGWWPGDGITADVAAGNSGTLAGNATFGPGRVGQAFVFDGSGDGVLVGNPASLRRQDFTIEAWIRRASVSAVSLQDPNDAGLVSYGSGGYGFGLNNNGSLYLTKVGVNKVTVAAPVTDTKWHYVAVTKAGTSVIFYVDGVAYPAPPYNSVFTFSNNLAIGSSGTLTFSFLGSIDEMAVYDRALSGVEIQSIYGANLSGKCALPVSILRHPQSQTVRAGTNVSFNVLATGTPLTYQWRFDATNTIVGATNSSLVLTNVQPTANGDYAVVISNELNSVTSAPASLSVRYVFVFGNGQNLTNSQYTFIGFVNLQLQTFFTSGTIFYTLDGSQPSFASTQYTGPFAITQSSLLRVITYSADFFQSWEGDAISLTIIPTYSLQAVSAGGGTVSMTPTNSPYVSNTVVNITATPASGWTFLGWLGDASGTNTTNSFTMNRNKFVQARFGTTLSTTAAGNGAVTLIPPGGFYPFGTVVQLHGVPQPGNYFVLWGNAGSGNGNPLNFTLTNANPTVSALFSSLGVGEFALTVIPDGFGRVMVSPQANRYTTGQGITLTALPDAGQQFINWTGDASGTNNPLMIVMNPSKTIVANFTRRPSLSVSRGLNGLNELGFRLTLTGEFGSHYRIDGSTNLVEWTDLLTLTNTYGTTQVTDESATNVPLRFYKATLVP